MTRYRFEEIAINSTEKKKPTSEDKDRYIGLEHLDSGSLTVTRFGADVAPIGEKLLMKKGDVLFGKRRAYQKKVAIAPFDGIFSAHGMVLRPNEAVVTREFFPFFISSDYFLNAAIKISVGSLSPTINWRELKEVEFDLPSLEEQKRLAEILWAAENEIEMLYHSIERAHQLLSSFIKHEKGTPIHLDKLVKICYGKSQKDVSSEKGQYPIYGTGGVLGYTNASLYNNESIIVGRKGTIDKPTYVPDSFWAVDTTYYLKPLSDFSMKWLYVYLRYGVNLYDLNEATGVPSINAERLAKLVIILLPKEKQMEVESLLLNIEEVIDRLYKQIEITNELKRQILSCKMC